MTKKPEPKPALVRADDAEIHPVSGRVESPRRRVKTKQGATSDTITGSAKDKNVDLAVRVPKSLPLSLAWEASILVDGVAKASFRVRAGRERVMRDLAANVSKLAGLHTVGVRLALVSA